MRLKAYIGFGTNLGDLTANFARAKTELLKIDGILDLRASPLYYTEPLTKDGETQPWYLNGVFEIVTSLSLHQLFFALKDIEKAMGRSGRKKWAPRIVDLDLLFYDSVIYSDDLLTLPHQEIANRLFVLLPLHDLAPDLMHPEFEMPVRELLQANQDALKVTRYCPAPLDESRGEA